MNIEIYTCTVISIKPKKKWKTCEHQASIQFLKHEITLYGVLH